MFTALLVHLAFVTLPPCSEDVQDNCVVDASINGGVVEYPGQSFVVVGGQRWGVITR